ncbi:Hypothetical protein FKW44_006344 [Caligus rogercresseyi]|uniref:Uncharacterized protein n=1 Tax=Caligus rogercresseyi TaxID=217165 RepID=A0A7T8KD99_CALRO|nr:Hypothetical protein FKW44_006344 [Caligus rogercresseyi]
MGIGVSNPSPLVKIRVRNPSNAILCTLGPRVRQPQQWVLGFQTFATCKNSSKEPLKCHFMHLGPRVLPAATMGIGVSNPSPL